MIEPQRPRSLFGLLVALLVAIPGACSAAPQAVPHAPAANEDAKLKLAAQAHTDLTAQLAAAPHDLLVFCQTTAGDCLISLAERRETLVGKHYLNACRDPEPDKQSPCIEHELAQRGERVELASFYETENWCSRKLLECITNATNNAEQMAIRQRTQERRAEVEAAPESVRAEREPEFAKERLSFVRSIVPPQGQVACAPSPPAECATMLAAPSAKLEAVLGRAPADYEPKRAVTLYVSLKQSEAQCFSPEIACLVDQLPLHGTFPEFDKLLKQNLILISDQQSIRVQAMPEAAEQCISAGVTQHSDRIVSAYQAYAGAPTNTALLLRLQKAFIAMHQAQLWCLKPLYKPSKR